MANSGGAEELLEGDLQRECVDEVCNYEEARETIEIDVQGLKNWYEQHRNNSGSLTNALSVGLMIFCTLLKF